MQNRAEAGFASNDFVRIDMVQAKVFGLDDACILSRLDYRLQAAEKIQTPDKDGRVWVRLSWREAMGDLGYLVAEKTLRRRLRDLDDLGVVLRKTVSWYEDPEQKTMYTLNYGKILEMVEAFRTANKESLKQVNNLPGEIISRIERYGDPGRVIREFRGAAEIEGGLPSVTSRGGGHADQTNNKNKVNTIQKKVESIKCKVSPEREGGEEDPEGTDPQDPIEPTETADGEIGTQVLPGYLYLSSRDVSRPFTGDIQGVCKELEKLIQEYCPENLKRLLSCKDPKVGTGSLIEHFSQYLLYERGKQSLLKVPNPEGNPGNVYPGVLQYFKTRWQSGIHEGTSTESLTFIHDWDWWSFIQHIRLPETVRPPSGKESSLLELAVSGLKQSLLNRNSNFRLFGDWLYRDSGLNNISLQSALAPRTYEIYCSSNAL